MSIDALRKRLARLEAAKRHKRVKTEGMTAMDHARSIAFVLKCAVEGHGGQAMLDAGTQIAHVLAGVLREPTG